MTQPTNTPSKNAVRAAEKICEEYGLETWQNGPQVPYIAKIIDQEAGVKELKALLIRAGQLITSAQECFGPGEEDEALLKDISKALREVGE
jgi:hypothetical protein